MAAAPGDDPRMGRYGTFVRDQDDRTIVALADRDVRLRRMLAAGAAAMLVVTGLVLLSSAGAGDTPPDAAPDAVVDLSEVSSVVGASEHAAAGGTTPARFLTWIDNSQLKLVADSGSVADSQQVKHPASNVIDGNAFSSWMSQRSDNQFLGVHPRYMIFDLGAAASLSAFKYKTFCEPHAKRASCPKFWTLSSGATPSGPWVTAFTCKLDDAEMDSPQWTVPWEFTPVTARYWKWNIDYQSYGDNTYIYVYEIAFSGDYNLAQAVAPPHESAEKEAVGAAPTSPAPKSPPKTYVTPPTVANNLAWARKVPYDKCGCGRIVSASSPKLYWSSRGTFLFTVDGASSTFRIVPGVSGDDGTVSVESCTQQHHYITSRGPGAAVQMHRGALSGPSAEDFARSATFTVDKDDSGYLRFRPLAAAGQRISESPTTHQLVLAPTEEDGAADSAAFLFLCTQPTEPVATAPPPGDADRKSVV